MTAGLHLAMECHMLSCSCVCRLHGAQPRQQQPAANTVAGPTNERMQQRWPERAGLAAQASAAVMAVEREASATSERTVASGERAAWPAERACTTAAGQASSRDGAG